MNPIDWTKPVCTKHETPHIGEVQPDCPLSGRKRVLVASPSAPQGIPTVFRYDENGRARGDGQPSDNDLVNYDPDDGAFRVGLDGRSAACVRQAA